MRTLLQDSFSPDNATDLDTDIELRFPDHSVLFSVRDQILQFTEKGDADLVLYFESSEQAERLFRGEEDIAAAFMRGQLRSNGHLTRVFLTFAAFSGLSKPEPSRD